MTDGHYGLDVHDGIGQEDKNDGTSEEDTAPIDVANPATVETIVKFNDVQVVTDPSETYNNTRDAECISGISLEVGS